MKKLIALVFSLFLALPATAQMLKPYGGEALPDFTLNDIKGRQHTLSDYRGKVVMVNFWATYCSPCIKEMPSIQRLKEKLSGRPFEILAVDMAETRDDVQAFMQRHNIQVNFPLLLDPEGEVVEQWMISAVPTTFIIDSKGEIRYALFGGLEWDNDEVVQTINGLLAD